MSVYDVYKDYVAQPSTYTQAYGNQNYVAPPSTYTQAYGNNNQPPPPPQQQGPPVSQGVGAHYAPAPTPIWNPQTQQWQLPDGTTPQTMNTAPVANPQAIGAHYAPAPPPAFNPETTQWEGPGSDSGFMNTVPKDSYDKEDPFANLTEDEKLRFGRPGWLRQQMTDDKGIFRGGREGRMFGRARDWWEDNVKGGGNASSREDGLVVADDFEGYDSQRTVNEEYRQNVDREYR